jgi:hypothetical protein
VERKHEALTFWTWLTVLKMIFSSSTHLLADDKKSILMLSKIPWYRNITFSGFFVVLGLELRDFTLSHSTSPIFCDRYFRDSLMNYFPRLASNCNAPDLCLLSSWDFRCEPPTPWNITFCNQTCIDINSHVFVVMETYMLSPSDKKHEGGLLHDILTLFLGNYHSDCAILISRI